jgi:hypothetical protein
MTPIEEYVGSNPMITVQDGQHQGGLSAPCIAKAADDDPTQWAKHEADPEHQEGVQQRRSRVAFREKIQCQRSGEVAEHAEIVPLHDIADGRGIDRLAALFRGRPCGHPTRR